MTGEKALKLLVVLLAIPAIAAPGTYRGGSRGAAIALNGLLPLLVIIASAIAMVGKPVKITPGGLLLFSVPVSVLVACGVGYRVPRAHPVVFWVTWAINVAIVAFFGYLAFFFKIF
jgi:hypothetical protein